MSKYIDPRYKDIKPYTPGEQPKAGSLTKLNTNENPYPPSAAVQQAVQGQVSTLHRYPPPAAEELVNALAHQHGIQPENVFVSNGSDEALAFCFQALCPNGAAFADITYGFYPVYSKLYHVNSKIIPLRQDFTLNPEDYTGLAQTLFIANPNAPTGLALSLAQLEDLLQEDRLVIVDEAYVDFGAQSAVQLLDRYKNLMVIGTFSKSHSLAGARLGYAIASQELIEDLNRIKFSFNPYNVNRMTIAAGVAALQDKAYHEQCKNATMEIRRQSLDILHNMGFSCTNSMANFVFASHKNVPAEEIYVKLKQRNVLVRWFAQPRIDNYVRITIGTQSEMNILFSELRGIL